jgi:fluoroacetyl-CoA thioesterase
MKSLATFAPIKYLHKVDVADFPTFNNQVVHEVYSTYALARDAEWAGRLVLLPLLEIGEEGIGSAVEIQHLAPAFEHEEVLFTTSQHLQPNDNTLVVHMSACVGARVIATIVTTQKVVHKEKLNAVWAKLKQGF